MVLVQNLPFFNLLFLKQCRPGKCVSWYFIAFKRLSELKKTGFERVEKLSLFQRG